MKKQIILLFLLLFCVFPVKSQWLQQSYNPTMKGSYFFSGTGTGWTVTENGIIRKTTDAGASWATQYVTNNVPLNEVFFITTFTGWAVGNSGTILYTIDGGTTWSAQTSGTVSNLFEVNFIDLNTGFAAGSVLLKTTNKGVNWTAINDASFNGFIYSIFIRSSSLIYMTMSTDKVYKSTNIGANWSIVSTLPNAINELYFLNDNTGFGAGNSGTVYKTQNSGVNWTPYATGSSMPLRSILFITAGTGFAGGDDNKIYRTTDAGLNWSPAVTSSFAINDLSVFGSSQVFACGSNGLMYNSNSGATAWYQLFQGSGNNIYDINFINVMTGWAANGSNDILTTTNGGINWQTAAFGFMSAIRNVYFINGSTGFILGGSSSDAGSSYSIGKTTNGGSSFTETYITAYAPRGIQFVNTTDGYALFEDASENALLYKTTNTGANWQLVNQSLNNYPGFYFTTQLNGWMCGINGGIQKTTNGGANWTAQPTGASEYFYSVFFQNGNYGWACGSNGKIIATTNGGTNWVSQSSGVTSPLTDIKFTSTTNGICVGANGVRLVTSNGGATWVNNGELSRVNFNKICYASPTQVYTVGDFGYIAVSPGITGIEPVNNLVPNSYTLGQNYPNPFNPSTKIEFALPQSQFTSLVVYDVTGKAIKSLVNETLSAGNYSISFNAEGLATGVYFYRLSTDKFTQVKKMILIK